MNTTKLTKINEVKEDLANETRLRYKYRKLVARGQVKIPIRLAQKLAGPDCAYHLYSQHNPKTK